MTPLTQLAKVGVKDALALALDQSVEESPRQDLVDLVAAVAATHATPVRVATQKFQRHLAVAEGAGSKDLVKTVHGVFAVSAASEQLFTTFLGHSAAGS